jgi:alpha-beta hydrolase superfamily lysophospholipase
MTQTTDRHRGRALLHRLAWLVAVAVAAAVGVYLALVWLGQPREPGRFYKAPAQTPAEPGRLVRVEAVRTDVSGADAYRILYSSRDWRDRPVVVSGLVLVPSQPAGDHGFPVVAWAHGTSGIARRCAPSLRPQATTQLAFGAQELVADGAIVVATDYAGLGTEGPHPYLVGSSATHAVLDAVRAVQGYDDWRATPRFVLWGYSQGGHAALFASQHARAYAPELDHLGTAVAAPPTDLSALFTRDLREPAAKIFGSMALKSWSEIYPGAELTGIVKAEEIPLIEAISAHCIEDAEQALAELPEMALMRRDFLTRDPVAAEPWASIIRRNTVTPDAIAVVLPDG